MFRLPSEKEEHKDTIGALILSIFIIIAGIGGMIYTKHESSEFKNSTDVRTLHAIVLKRMKKTITEIEKKNIR